MRAKHNSVCRWDGITRVLEGRSRQPAKPDLPPGLYMYGGVGVGKTMLMDLLVKCAPSQFQACRALVDSATGSHAQSKLCSRLGSISILGFPEHQLVAQACKCRLRAEQGARMRSNITQLLFNPRLQCRRHVID